MKRSVPTTVVLAATALLALFSQVVAAHPGHDHPSESVPLLPVALLVVGTAAIVGSVQADRRGLLDRRAANVGMVVGIWVALVGITLIWW